MAHPAPQNLILDAASRLKLGRNYNKKVTNIILFYFVHFFAIKVNFYVSFPFRFFHIFLRNLHGNGILYFNE